MKVTRLILYTINKISNYREDRAMEILFRMVRQIVTLIQVAILTSQSTKSLLFAHEELPMLPERQKLNCSTLHWLTTTAHGG